MPKHTHKKRAFGNVSKRKAKKMLEEGEAHGKKLTKKQRGALGARAGGK